MDQVPPHILVLLWRPLYSHFAIPAKEAFRCRLILRPFMSGITTSETDAFILIHLAESIFRRAASSTTYLS
jgi:hypothetical protein